MRTRRARESAWTSRAAEVTVARSVIRIAVLALAFVLSARLAAAATISWMVDGVERFAIIYAPKSLPAGKLPLIFSFHGHGDDMENFQYVGLQSAWPDAIVVYFQGLPSRDGYSGWQVEPGEYGDRDLKMVDVALAALKKKYNVDDNRIYATGFSNGAHFTYLLWAARPDVFAAFAPVAGRIRPTAMPKVPKPILIIGGERDQQVAFQDQRAAIGIATRVNGAAAPVMTWIHPGGHEYPRPTSGKIAEFFHEHVRGD